MYLNIINITILKQKCILQQFNLVINLTSKYNRTTLIINKNTFYNIFHNSLKIKGFSELKKNLLNKIMAIRNIFNTILF